MPGLCTGGLSLVRLWRQGRNSAIRRIDNQRSAPCRYDLCSAVVPEVVISKGDVSFRILVVAAIRIIVLKHSLFIFRRFLFRKKLLPCRSEEHTSELQSRGHL